jgi:hypothetical protein
MRRKVLQDIANTLCQMVVGWRMGDDYEHMAQLPDGTLSFDLLEEKASHSCGEYPKLWITGELSAWLKNRLAVERVESSKLAVAKLEVTYKTDRIKTDRKKIISFDFECRSTLETDEAKYEGSLVERHAYHQRVGA